MSPIYVLRHDAPTGPFSEEEIQARISRGELTATDFAWRDGMAAWQPLTEVIALPSAPPPYPPVARPKARPAHRKQRVSPEHRLAGLTEFLEVFPDRLTITPKGGLGLQTKGDAPGIREIFLTSLLGIEYKLPGFTSGYLEIRVAGGADEPGAVLFRFAKSAGNNDAAGQITAFVEARLHEMRAVPQTMSAASLSDELGKLAALHGQGSLTDAEFQAAKQRLLS